MELYFDGLCQPNPGVGTYGYAAIENGRMVKASSGFLGDKVTNNIAEYSALINGLRAVVGMTDRLIVKGDSQLVIRQASGQYKCHEPHLKKLLNEVRALSKKFKHITFEWIPREQNSLADSLAQHEYYRNVMPSSGKEEF